MKFKLFDFLNDINSGKKNILRNNEHSDKDYSPWIINVGLSLNVDTVLYADEMNRFYTLPKQTQYDYYIHSIRQSKRFAKWPKKLKKSGDCLIISKIFNINITRAEEYIKLMDKNKLKELIKTYTNFGGTK